MIYLVLLAILFGWSNDNKYGCYQVKPQLRFHWKRYISKAAVTLRTRTQSLPAVRSVRLYAFAVIYLL